MDTFHGLYMHQKCICSQRSATNALLVYSCIQSPENWWPMLFCLLGTNSLKSSRIWGATSRHRQDSREGTERRKRMELMGGNISPHKCLVMASTLLMGGNISPHKCLVMASTLMWSSCQRCLLACWTCGDEGRRMSHSFTVWSLLLDMK